jgi:3-oxoacyl-[acyl-carrier protein] reductase
MENLLRDTVAVVSGGTSGIGKEIANSFLLSGAKVAILGSNPDKGSKALEELKATSENVRFYPVDVSSKSTCAEVMAQIEKELGPVDILVNNAGIVRDNLFMRLSEEDWDRVIEVNLKSIFNLTQPVCRPMMKRRKGVIINVSSVVGLTGNAGQVNYSASKAGIIGATKSLAKEMASRGIRVNCIAPGFIRTAMTEELTDAQKEGLLKGIPMGRMADPKEIANVALFLASDLSSYMTGQVITADGGMVM